MLRRIIAIGAISVVAFGALSAQVFAEDPTYGGTAVKSVTATLVDTTGTAIGTVQLHQDAGGVVLVRLDAAGLPTGAHGMHIHAVGRCEGPAFASAGGHFNPSGHKHGLNNPDGPHEGDLTQIGESFTGTGTVMVTTNRISLTAGPNFIGDADGSALVVHAAADDQMTDPTGNSGGRIACAVLAAAQPGAAPAAAATTTAPAPPATGSGSALQDDQSPAIALVVAAAAVLCAGAAAFAVRPR
ncbi:MAG: superoxide dismutase family protein [Tepidiformaceae bacterium]